MPDPDPPTNAPADDLAVDPIEVDRAGRRAPRPRWISAVVVLVGLGVLWSMAADFRYWTRPDQPEDLGHARELFEHGTPPGLEQRYVRVRGTPDVQHAAVGQLGGQGPGRPAARVEYFRLVEGKGALFAMVPRVEQRGFDAYPGEFVGRTVRLGGSGWYPALQKFFETDINVDVVDASTEDLRATLAAGSGRLRTIDGEVDLVGGDRLRLVVREPESTVQIGKGSHPRREQAEAVVAGLGFPYAVVEHGRSAPFHTFVVRIPPAELEGVRRRLTEIPGSAAADTRIRFPLGEVGGATVLDRTATYTVPAEAVTLRGDHLAFPYGDNTTSPGYEVVDSRLVEREITDGNLEVALAAVQAVRLERRLRVDPDGVLIVVGSAPSGQRTTAALCGALAAIVGVNLLSLVLGWRRGRRPRIVADFPDSRD